MQGGIGPRFLLEAGFLIALAVGAGIADLSATTIVVVMAVAWLLVCLFELAVWAEGPRFPAFRRERVLVEDVPPAAEAPLPVEPMATPPAAEPVATSPADSVVEPEQRRGRFWRRSRPAPEPVPTAADAEADGEAR